MSKSKKYKKFRRDNRNTALMRYGDDYTSRDFLENDKSQFRTAYLMPISKFLEMIKQQ